MILSHYIEGANCQRLRTQSSQPLGASLLSSSEPRRPGLGLLATHGLDVTLFPVSAVCLFVFKFLYLCPSHVLLSFARSTFPHPFCHSLTLSLSTIKLRIPLHLLVTGAIYIEQIYRCESRFMKYCFVEKICI